MAVIDLGEVANRPYDAHLSTRPYRAVRLVALLLILAVVVELRGSESPQPVPRLLFIALSKVDATGAASFAVVGDSLLVSASPNELSSRRLVDGAINWKWLVGPGGQDLYLGRNGIVVAGGTCADEATTTMLDPSTGEAIWQRPGTPQYRVDADLLTLLRIDPYDWITSDGRLCSEADATWIAPPRHVANHVDLVERRTGAVRTSVDVARGIPVAVSEDGRAAAVLDPGGRLVTYDLGTGSTITRDLGFTPNDLVSLAGAGASWVMLRPVSDDETIVEAFARATLVPQWMAHLD